MKSKERGRADVGFADSCRILCQRISNKVPRRPWHGSSSMDITSDNSRMISAAVFPFPLFIFSFATEVLCSSKRTFAALFSRLTLVCASLELLMGLVCAAVPGLRKLILCCAGPQVSHSSSRIHHNNSTRKR